MSSNNVGLAVQSIAFGPVVYTPAAPIASGVSILGTLYIGQTLTGDYTYTDANNDVESGSTFQWSNSSSASGPWTAISGATNKTYVPTVSDNNKWLQFTVTVKNATAPTTGVPVSAVTTNAIFYAPTAPIASNVTVTGTPYVGNTLTGSYTFFDVNGDTEGPSTFQWYSASTTNGTYTPIDGATGLTYVLTANEINKYLKFEVTPISI